MSFVTMSNPFGERSLRPGCFLPMTVHLWLLAILLGSLGGAGAAGAQDPGKEQIGTVKTEVLYASEDVLAEAGETGKLEEKEFERLQASSTFSKGSVGRSDWRQTRKRRFLTQ